MSPEHDAKEDVKEQARSFAEQQKKAGAEKIGGVAGAIHGAAHELEKQLPQAAAYVHDAAGKLEHAASSLDTQSVDDLLRNVRSFARGQPAAFFGGAVLAGFAISRFLKSTGDSRQG